MSKIVRFGVSLEKELISKFDKHIKQKNYPTRSKAIGDLIREILIKHEWTAGKEVVGTVTLVYNHHKRELMNKLTDIQHNFHKIIISTQHIHMDEDNCLEIIVVKGKSDEVRKLAQKLNAEKGVKNSSLTMTTTGKNIL